MSRIQPRRDQSRHFRTTNPGHRSREFRSARHKLKLNIVEVLESRRLLSPLRTSGLKPHFLDKLATNNVVLPPGFFGIEDTDVRASFSVAGYGGGR